MILPFRLDKSSRRRLLYRSFGLVSTAQLVSSPCVQRNVSRGLEIRDIVALEIVSRLPRLGWSDSD